MPNVLLRPYVLGFKNHILQKVRTQGLLNRDAAFLVLGAVVMGCIFWFLYFTLRRVTLLDQAITIVPARILSIGLFAFFMLLFLSSFATALGGFYSSRDLPLLLSLPISKSRLYCSRLCEIIINSSWMFLLFAVPSLLAFSLALDLPWTFSACAVLVGIPYIVIPSTVASIIVMLVVSIVPASRLKEIVAILAFCFVAYLFYVGQTLPTSHSSDPKSFDATLEMLASLKDPHPYWLPSRWASDILSSFFTTPRHPVWLLVMLLMGTALGLAAIGFLIYDGLFYRGWTLATQQSRVLRIPASRLFSLAARIMLPFRPQLRALFAKDVRMLLRDTTQSLQLLLLLVLTFVYLYNFRSLRAVSSLSMEAQSWWQAILAIANIALGACVISAVATRFVFPAISLEGHAYNLLRTAPLSISQLLWHKFVIWLLPMSVLSIVLIVSGALAIRVPPSVVQLSALLAIAINIGIVGLGIGVGAVYAKFDWDNPSQITASFGSLVYMLLTIALTFVSLIPASFLLVLATVDSLADHMPQSQFLIISFCSYFLVFFISFAAASRAIKAGAQTLTEREVV